MLSRELQTHLLSPWIPFQASLEDIADADLTSHSAESGSTVDRLLDGHDRATAAAAASGAYQQSGAGRNRAQLRVSFTLPVDDESDFGSSSTSSTSSTSDGGGGCGGCGSSLVDGGWRDGSIRSCASSGALSSVTVSSQGSDHLPNMEALHIRGGWRCIVWVRIFELCCTSATYMLWPSQEGYIVPYSPRPTFEPPQRLTAPPLHLFDRRTIEGDAAVHAGHSQSGQVLVRPGAHLACLDMRQAPHIQAHRPHLLVRHIQDEAVVMDQRFGMLTMSLQQEMQEY